MDVSQDFSSEKRIKELLPHRYPFLLVDKVLELVPGESIIAQKNISISEPIFQGHFPGDAIYPGVYLIEGMAQAGGILAQMSFRSKGNSLLTGVQEARFKRKVLPGDTLYYHIKLEKKKSSLLFFSGQVKVDGKLAASCSFSAWSNLEENKAS